MLRKIKKISCGVVFIRKPIRISNIYSRWACDNCVYCNSDCELIIIRTKPDISLYSVCATIDSIVGNYYYIPEKKIKGEL